MVGPFQRHVRVGQRYALSSSPPYPISVSRDRVILSAIIGVLIVALFWLGILLYRWSLQVSEVTRLRVGVGLQAMMTDWQLEFYRRISETPIALQVGPDSGAHDDWKDYSERYRRHIRQTADPGLVKDVFLWETSRTPNPRLLRFDSNQEALAATTVPPSLTPLLTQLQQNSSSLPRALQLWRASSPHSGEQAAPSAAPFDAVVTGWQFAPDIPAVVHPIIHHRMPGDSARADVPSIPDWIVIIYDWGNISTELIPHITQEYFGNPEGLEFKLAVLRQTSKSRANVIYSSDADFKISTPPDASMNIFGPAPKTIDSQALQPSAQPSAIVASDWQNLPGLIWFPVIQPAQGRAERWELRVAHRRDSIASIIIGFRRRNLLVALSILGVLSLVMLVVLIAAYRAHTLSRLQMQFVASVSHELRTPLAVLSSSSQNIADGIVRDPARMAQYREIMARQIQHLSQLVDQVLRFAATKKDALPITRSAIDVTAVLQQALADLEGFVQQSGVTVHNSVPPHLPKVLGDASALSQCFQNLLTNAIKYSGNDRWIGIDAQISKSALRSHPLQVTVRDHGIGIPASELPHIFEPFYRTTAVTASNIHGTGLGLSITKNLVEAIGGRITVESSPGEGTAFTIHLEIAPDSVQKSVPGSNA